MREIEERTVKRNIWKSLHVFTLQKMLKVRNSLPGNHAPAKEYGQSLETGEGKETNSSIEPPPGKQSCQPILDF